MRVIELKDVLRKETHLHYRREFTACAVLDILDRPMEKRIEFTMESTPLGTLKVNVHLIDQVEYPVIPILSGIKDFVTDLDRRGHLP